VWHQFGAAIDMMENALRDCPPKVWGDRPGYFEFWCIAFHTLFFLDYYLSDRAEGFAPPDPFTLSELDPAGVLPDRVYTRDELLAYLRHGREKCRARIAGLTEASASERPAFGDLDLPWLELLLYNMRHVQHHTAQLNLLLRQGVDGAPRWVRRTSRPLAGG
jgi:hypothetical protein